MKCQNVSLKYVFGQEVGGRVGHKAKGLIRQTCEVLIKEKKLLVKHRQPEQR